MISKKIHPGESVSLKTAAIAYHQRLFILIEKYVSSLNDEFSRENVFVKKQAKNGKEENFDIKPLIKSISIEAGNYNTILIKVNCLAGSKSNLNPNYIIQLIKIIIPEDELDDYNIHRTELLINT